MKKIFQAIPGKTLAFSAFLVLLLGFLLFAPFPESPKPEKESSAVTKAKPVGPMNSAPISPPSPPFQKAAAFANASPEEFAPTAADYRWDMPRRRDEFGSALPFREQKLPPAALESLRASSPGNRVELELFPDIAYAVRVTGRWEDQGETRIAGNLEGQTVEDRFFMTWKGEEARGDLLLPSRNTAYEILFKDGTYTVREWLYTDRVCARPANGGRSAVAGLPRPEDRRAEKSQISTTSFINPADVPILNSRPGATAVIYLDFDGETVSGTAWLNGATIVAPAARMTADQIREAWERVVRDFESFDVNVTTQRSVHNAAPLNRRTHCIVTSNNAAAPGAGGVAYVGSFTDNISNYKICWVFQDAAAKSCAEAASHEVGHTLGLSHHGRVASGSLPFEEYYAGHGSGETGWAPIMGVGYYYNLTQWSKGEYNRANNPQDDVAIMAQSNKIPLVGDDYGSTLATATPISGAPVTGRIEQRTDFDFFRINLTAGEHRVRCNPHNYSNLDLELQVLNASGGLMTSNNPIGAINASALLTLPTPQTVYLRVDGVGEGNPLTTGYTDYGCLGNYTIQIDSAPDFQTLSSSGLNFTRGGNGTWIMQTSVKPANADAAARSGNTDANSTSWFETTVTGPGTLRYWRKVSSESGYDFLRVLLNGNQIDGASWSGEQDWQEQTVSIPAGNHTVRWQYSKDGSVDRGLDAAFIAQVVYQNIPATSPPDLFIRSLGTTNATVIDHNSLTGDDRGGLALSANRVFVNGDESAARFNLADLGGGMSVGRKLDGLCSDLETRTVYTLALDGVPYASGGTLVNQLIQLDGTTGNLTSTVIALSSSITLSSNTSIGIFSGRGRVLIHNGSRVYDVRLPSGIVIDLGAMAKPAWRNTEISAVWGVAESFEGSLFLAYRANSGNSFLRSRIPNGATELISNFTNLNDLASWSIDLPSNRWFFHYEESAQFGGEIETLGFASGNFGTTRSAPVVQNPMSANGMVGSWFSFQILASHGPTFFSAAFLPSGLFMDASTGLISGEPLEAGVWTVPLSVSNSAGTMNSTLQITISPPPPVIDSALSVNGAIGTAFSYQITATNSPTSFAADGLPSGLSLDTTTGLISGTPTATGNSTVGLSATNAGGTGNATLTISIAVAPPVINSPLTANGTVGAGFNYQISATNAPASFGATGLPTGLSLNPNTGMISGIPTAAGNSTVTLTATNSSGTTNATLLVSIVAQIPVINSATHADGTLGSIFSYQITATNSPSSFAAIGLPAWLTLNSTTGVIRGTPTTAASLTVTLTATNSSGTSSAATLFIAITAGPPVINSSTSASGTVGSSFSYLMTATNNPTSFGAGGLPTGLAINSSTGAINGIPRAAGNFSINASATNSGGTSSRMLSFNIAKGSQTISGVTPFASRLLGAAAYSLNATVISGLAISYASSNTSVAAISANGTVSILGAGTTTLTATQNGDANWNPAPGVSQTLTVAIPIVPTLSVTPSSLGDFNATSGTPSASLKFDVSGTNLEGAVSIVAPAGYEVSRDGNSYSSSLTINPDLPVLASDSASNYGFTGPTGWANGSNRGTGFSSWSFTVVNNPPAFHAGAFIGDPAAAEITNMPSPAFGLYANPGNTAASVTVSRSFAQPLAVGDSFSFQWATNWDSDVGNKGFNIFAGGVEVVNINQAGYPGNITCNGQLAIDGASGYGSSPMAWTFTRTSPTNLQVTSTARNGTPVLAFSTNITISTAPSGFSFYATAMAAGNDQRQPYFNNFRIVSTTATGGNLTTTPIFVRLSVGAPTGPVSGNITVTSANATQRMVTLTGNMAILRTLAVNPPGPISLSTTFNLASSATPVAVTGTNLTTNITATAPANFEVSTSNSSFGSSATLLPAGGNLFLRIASTAPVGYLSGNLSLVSGEASTTLVLLGTVVGSGFDAWPVLLDLPDGCRGMLDRNGPQNLPNLLAYAMGLNPLTATAADLPLTGNFNAAARTIDITYRRAKNLPDVALNVEGSASLNSGFAAATVAAESVLEDGADHQIMRATISISTGTTRYFLRLRASGPQ